jgi:hypothetical protein
MNDDDYEVAGLALNEYNDDDYESEYEDPYEDVDELPDDEEFSLDGVYFLFEDQLEMEIIRWDALVPDEACDC